MMKLPTWVRVRLQTFALRRAFLAEGFDIRSILNKTSFPVSNDPFPHIIVDDFLKDEPYRRLLAHFNSVVARGFSEGGDYKRFHPFFNLTGKYAYDGYLYIPDAREPIMPVFPYTVAWNLLFASMFKRPTGWCTSFAYHYHPPHNRTGFVHSDFSSKMFSPVDRLRNGVIFRDREGPQTVPTFKEQRTIALIYYLGNDDWKEGDGGETGLYVSETSTPATLVAPKNNRLLAFEISPKSFHAFQENKTVRTSIVQWFHVDEQWGNSHYGTVR